MAQWIRVGDADGLAPGEMTAAAAGSEYIVVCNVDGDFYAVEDLCSHQDLPLSDGELDGNELLCIHHGARFDVCTGKALCLPALTPVRTFDVEVRDGGIFVEVG